MASKHLINPELIAMANIKLASVDTASAKQAFVAGGDPAMTGADPNAAAGGAPPAGVDPSGGAGGAPPAPAPAPAPAGGMDPSTMATVQTMIQQAVASSGAGGAGGQAIKPKIDVNIEIMQIKKMLARLCDAMGVQIPAAEMTATSQDLTQMATQQQNPAQAPASGIAPIQPMTGDVGKTAALVDNGDPFGSSAELGGLRDRAAAVFDVLRRRQAS